ncbi:transcriptional regulator, MerR family [mine drainage metagenome]|uniref:Transcriptional regulator, MerR family n=1 Tax=mine drainage metagenome TaxID=410659 RepID=T0ZXL4_9ZZZZ
MNSFKIGEVARHTGVLVDTIHYYERAGLLPEPARRPSGYRTYDAEAICRLRFIRRAKALGFSLAEIGELLTISTRQDIQAVKTAARRKRADLDQRISELTHIRDALDTLIEHCPGRGGAASCPILSALNDGADKDP